jgi:hypothetical protein
VASGNIDDPEFTFNDLVDWAASYLLIELIAGRFRQGVWMVCSQSVRWRAMRSDEAVGANMSWTKKVK